MILITPENDSISIVKNISDSNINDDGFWTYTPNSIAFVEHLDIVEKLLDALYTDDILPSDALADGIVLVIKDNGVCQTLPKYLIERTQKQASQKCNEKITKDVESKLFDKTSENLQLTREVLTEIRELFPKQISKPASTTIVNKSNKKKFLL